MSMEEPMALPSVPKEIRDWVRDTFPPMPQQVFLEFAGLDDFDVLYNAVVHSSKDQFTDRDELIKYGLALAYSLEELGFHR